VQVFKPSGDVQHEAEHSFERRARDIALSR
jgi:hypothetical protein